MLRLFGEFGFLAVPLDLTELQANLETGLVDRIGDYTDALNAAAEAGRTRPRVRLLQPRRSLSQRIFGRTSAEAAALAGLAGGLQRMLGGGIYYLDPAHLAGWPGEG